jgi:hypothetical protein
MAGQSWVFRRELGGCFAHGATSHIPGWGHYPAAFERDCSADPTLVKRLTCVAELPSEANSISTMCWSEQSDLIVSGGEDCRMTLWSAERQRALLTLEVVCPHSPSIL